MIVDSAVDAQSLPEADWYASPTFEGEPAYRLTKPNFVETGVLTIGIGPSGEGIALSIEGLPPAGSPASQALAAKIDKRTKAYREAQKAS